ncbi:hypothetical protein RRG08_041664 [Elysia crispata]|uniref:Uncharacterized protein n=1 Tax=Elysia crispata TaxID=231223 RepID=A0AAE1CVT7_9GAST|nr:hypothetical protein RRG08_041664 [Elysia crispata]
MMKRSPNCTAHFLHRLTTMDTPTLINGHLSNHGLLQSTMSTSSYSDLLLCYKFNNVVQGNQRVSPQSSLSADMCLTESSCKFRDVSTIHTILEKIKTVVIVMPVGYSCINVAAVKSLSKTESENNVATSAETSQVVLISGAAQRRCSAFNSWSVHFFRALSMALK